MKLDISMMYTIWMSLCPTEPNTAVLEYLDKSLKETMYSWMNKLDWMNKWNGKRKYERKNKWQVNLWINYMIEW